MTKDRTHRADLLFRPERSAQQTYRMQILQPLAIDDIALAPGYMLDMLRIHQAHLKASLFQDLKQRHPVDAG